MYPSNIFWIWLNISKLFAQEFRIYRRKIAGFNGSSAFAHWIKSICGTVNQRIRKYGWIEYNTLQHKLNAYLFESKQMRFCYGNQRNAIIDLLIFKIQTLNAFERNFLQFLCSWAIENYSVIALDSEVLHFRSGNYF